MTVSAQIILVMPWSELEAIPIHEMTLYSFEDDVAVYTRQVELEEDDNGFWSVQSEN